MHSYAIGMNLNKNVLKKYVQIQNFMFYFFGKQNGENFIFLIPNVLQPFGLFSWYNGLNALPVFLFMIYIP